MLKLLVTGIAAKYFDPLMVPPAWLAVIVQVPTLSSLTILPVTVHILVVLDVYATASLDDAVAFRVNDLAVTFLLVIAGNVIVCFLVTTLVAVGVRVTVATRVGVAVGRTLAKSPKLTGITLVTVSSTIVRTSLAAVLPLIVTVQLAPAAMVLAQVVVWVKADPLIPIDVTVIGLADVFVNVML
jgi:hypothetical protein